MNPKPAMSPVGMCLTSRRTDRSRTLTLTTGYVHPDKYKNYQLVPDIETGERCIQMLRDAGLNAGPNAKFDWIHDTFLILIRMFPNGCPPTVLISMNQSFDPHLHSMYNVAPAIHKPMTS